MDKEEFLKLLQNHDWSYRYSDDRHAFARGQREEQRIYALAAANPELQAVFDEFSNGGV